MHATPPAVAPSGTAAPALALAITTAAPAGAGQAFTASTSLTLTAPAPTATPQAAAQLADGRWLQSIGDCDGAGQAFAGAIASAAGGAQLAPAALSEARYRMAQCDLRDGAPAKAAAALTGLLSAAAPDDPYQAPATFLFGEAQSSLQEWDAAAASYNKYLALAPELSSYTWQRIAAASNAAGNPLGATRAYSAAVGTSPDWNNTVAIRRAWADLLVKQGDGEGAAAQYDVLRAGQTQGAWAAEMQWLAGSALDQSGDHSGAAARWQAAANADPTSGYAHDAMSALVDASVTVDDYQRGLVDYYAGVYNLAIQAFDRSLAHDRSGHQGQALYYEGRSYLALGRCAQAIAKLDNFVAAFPQSPLIVDASLGQARAQACAGNSGAALAAYRRLAAAHPDAEQAPTALWEAARLEAGAGNLGSADQDYLALGRRYPAADEGWHAYLQAGLDYFAAGNWQGAISVWAEWAHATGAPAFTHPVAFYWLGRTQNEVGNNDAARQAWASADQADPNSFYGMRAAARLAGAGQTLFAPGLVTFTLSSGQLGPDKAALAAWLGGWAGAGSLELSPAVQADADWQRGQALLTIGLHSEGVAAWTRLKLRYQSSPWTMAALALAFGDAGEYGLSIDCATQMISLAPQGQDPPAAVLRLAYPLPYAPLIQDQASRWQIDPRLVASVILQESRFDTAATSSAVAQGLMQIIPDTADWIANRLGRSDFQSDQIYWPYVNVEFGTYYLRQQLDAFDDSVALALSAYNGGPGNALRWQKTAPGDEDLTVASIDVTQSRLYVQLIYEHYAMYRKLYP